MSRKKIHYSNLEKWSKEYAQENDLIFHKYSDYHMRLIQDDMCCLDFWTTAKYYFKETNYYLYDSRITERAGEKGTVNGKDRKKFELFLNKAFYPIDFMT